MRVQAVFPFFTNQSRDVWTNTTHWLWDDEDAQPTPFDFISIVSVRLAAFYKTAMEGFRANYVNWTLAHVEAIDLGDPPPRVVHQSPLVIPTPGAAASSIPTEVACVVSYYSEPTSGINRGQRHNRFYLGGMSSCIAASTVSAYPTLQPQLITQCCTAAENLLGANADGIEWRQYSAVGPEPWGVLRPIVGGWVDNTPDTQRRRGVDASSRTAWAP